MSLKQNVLSFSKGLIEVGRRTYERGYVASNDGNMSARIGKNRVMITRKGISKGFMKAKDLIIVDMNGRVIRGNAEPSSEVFMHLQIYKERPDVHSVCHAHPPYATGFAVAGRSLDQHVLPEVIISLGTIPLVEYGTPGTADFYKPLLPLISSFDAFLLANHGALTVGKDVFDAYHKMETLEHFAHIAFVATQLGKVTSLQAKQVQTLIEARPKYGIRKNVGAKTAEGKSLLK